MELFSQVDKNGDGAIQLDEWVDFWTEVYASGYSSEEISYESDNSLIAVAGSNSKQEK